MKKKFAIAILFVGLVFILAGGYLYISNQKKDNSSKTEEQPMVEVEVEESPTYDVAVKDTNYINLMRKISERSFIKEDEAIIFEDLDNNVKLRIANSFRDKYANFEGATGKELTDIIHKYFGSNQTLKFENIKCEMKHDNADEENLYIYDANQDKYVVNTKHPGHGGKMDGAFSIFDNRDSNETKVNYNYKAISNKENTNFILEVKMMFYDNSNTGEVGPLEIKSVYKSYSNIEDKKVLVDIANNKQYVTRDSDGIPHYNLNKVYSDNLDKLDTYVFEFEKEGNNLIFTKFYKRT